VSCVAPLHSSTPSSPFCALPITATVLVRLVGCILMDSTFFLEKLQQHVVKGISFDIPAQSRVLKAWLDLAHLHNRPPKMVWKMRKPLFELCDHLGSRGVAERALFLMHSSVEKDPWELFCLASQRNNVGLAKSALRALAEIKDNGGDVPAVDGITPTLAAGLTLPYLLGLYVAALKGKEKVAGMTRQAGYAHSSHPSSAIDSDYGGLKEENGWKVIAEKFAPVTG